jgi:ABC-type sulfate/molybdate transport systems ATPase subunit
VLNLTDYLDRRPGQLSGGQRQRVAIGRAIVREPRRSSSTSRCRTSTRRCASDAAGDLELHKRLETTMIYVTHDQVEAMTMADKIVVLRAGNIEQVGSPLELYHNAAQPVRRRLHRLAEDEPDRREGRRSTARRPSASGPSISMSSETGDLAGHRRRVRASRLRHVLPRHLRGLATR